MGCVDVCLLVEPLKIVRLALRVEEGMSSQLGLFPSSPSFQSHLLPLMCSLRLFTERSTAVGLDIANVNANRHELFLSYKVLRNQAPGYINIYVHIWKLHMHRRTRRSGRAKGGEPKGPSEPHDCARMSL